MSNEFANLLSIVLLYISALKEIFKKDFNFRVEEDNAEIQNLFYLRQI